jgi:hypothetical protein
MMMILRYNVRNMRVFSIKLWQGICNYLISGNVFISGNLKLRIIKMKKLLLLTLILIGLIVTGQVYAQNDNIPPVPLTVTIFAKGTVLSPLSVTSSRDLDFGNDILPGVNRTIEKNSNSAGKFSILGQADKEITISIVTPLELVSGSNVLDISFTNTDAGYKLPGSSIVDFDPYNPINTNFGTEGSMDVMIGGTVKPTHQQASGEYEGAITVIFYYTGN